MQREGSGLLETEEGRGRKEKREKRGGGEEGRGLGKCRLGTLMASGMDGEREEAQA